MTLGPVMVDLAGTSLTATERELLRHASVGGVILFSRNYEDPAQLATLSAEIHALRSPPLLVAVDQEGGRVQRFVQGFSRLPPAHLIGRVFDSDAPRARELARDTGFVMASELLACGVDFSFAPVADLDRSLSEVIGDRAFHGEPDVVGTLAKAVMSGMREAGMRAVAKHFPGHGAVLADSHVSQPVDRRLYEDIAAEDLLPFGRLVRAGVPAIMTAHVEYPRVDRAPATLSPRWINGVLRDLLGFNGVVFSDDLSMEALAGAGPLPNRARLALAAGCDMVLVCNDRDGAVQVVEALERHADPVGQVRLARMHGRPMIDQPAELRAAPRWQSASASLAALMDKPSLHLDA